MRIEVMLESVVAPPLEIRELDPYPGFVLPARPDRDHPAEQAQLGLVLRHIRQVHPDPDGHLVGTPSLEPMGGDAFHGRLVAEYLQAGEGDVGGDARETVAILTEDADRVFGLDPVESTFLVGHQAPQGPCRTDRVTYCKDLVPWRTGIKMQRGQTLRNILPGWCAPGAV